MPSPLKHIAWDNLKGVSLLTGVRRGRVPHHFGHFLRLQDARKCIPGHEIWSKLGCVLTWPPPGFVSVTGREDQICQKMTKSQHLSGFSTKVGVASSDIRA